MAAHAHDYADEVHEHASPAVRVALVAAGTLCVAAGVIGIFLPLLPTTPFLLLAAACYARASRRLYGWLLGHPRLGPLILDWRRHGALPYRVKLTAIGLMAASLGSSIVFFVREPHWQVALAVLGLLLAAYLYRIPTRVPERG